MNKALIVYQLLQITIGLFGTSSEVIHAITILIRSLLPFEISKTRARLLLSTKEYRGEKDFSSLTFQLLILFKPSSQERLVYVGFFSNESEKKNVLIQAD